jgi:ectoine hydroxylase-related dioxygenase (phytanoyl-CoA dioxygenase family)
MDYVMIKLSQAHLDLFNCDGFVIVENVLDEAAVTAARDRFEPLFSGKFQTGLYPDEWNWRSGRDRDDLTRQICNAWKSDLTIASLVLQSDVGEAAATLRGWPGARIGQDNVIWKPPGAKPLGFHQDDSYNAWIVPGQMLTCWMTLDDTKAHQGTIEYVRGSHRWAVAPPIAQFHAPDDPLVDLRQAAGATGIENYEICPIEISAGSAVFHHGRTWHGSRANRGNAPRRAVVAHCISSAAKFHPRHVSYIYSRYKKVGSTDMDESYFPILWTSDGYRTPWLDAYVRDGRAAA